MDPNLILTILSIAISICSVSYAIYTQQKNKRTKEPMVIFKSDNLIQNHVSNLNGLEISYKGIRVDNLMVTKVKFINAGAEIINRSDIITNDPLRISAM